MPTKLDHSLAKRQELMEFLSRYSTERLIALKKQASYHKATKHWHQAVNQLLKE
jgi:hypothetical protein